ncbi:MAG: hypothetical protein WC408_02180 [Candidatus Micrarchaeia archaeon]|jgi:hypothetical protein
MNWLPALLILAFLTPFAFAAVPNCVLKVRILAPDQGYYAPDVNGNNIFLAVNVTNAYTNQPIDAQTTLVLDSGISYDVPKASEGNYSLGFHVSSSGTHSFSVLAEKTGCISDSVSQLYYFQKNPVRSAPDFHLALLPFVALAAIGIVRFSKKNRRT